MIRIENGRLGRLSFLLNGKTWITRLAPIVKDPSFKDEDEYRVIHDLQVSELPQLRFKQKLSLMSRYLPLIYPYQAQHRNHVACRLMKSLSGAKSP